MTLTTRGARQRGGPLTPEQRVRRSFKDAIRAHNQASPPEYVERKAWEWLKSREQRERS